MTMGLWHIGIIVTYTNVWCIFSYGLEHMKRLFCLLPIGSHKIMLQREKEPISFNKRLKNKELGHDLKDFFKVLKVK